MIGRSPTVLKINMKMNRANCFLVPAFQSAIPFQTISRTTSTMIKTIVPLANAGATCAATAVVSGVIVIY